MFNIPDVTFVYQRPKMYVKSGLFLRVVFYDNQGRFKGLRKYKVFPAW